MPSRTVLIFAFAVGLYPATASRLETGRAAPGADRQARVAEAYGVQALPERVRTAIGTTTAPPQIVLGNP